PTPRSSANRDITSLEQPETALLFARLLVHDDQTASLERAKDCRKYAVGEADFERERLDCLLGARTLFQEVDAPLVGPKRGERCGGGSGRGGTFICGSGPQGFKTE